MRSPAQIANDEKDRFIVRFHEEGKRKVLKDRARQSGRSLNSEICYLIKRGYEVEYGKAF